MRKISAFVLAAVILATIVGCEQKMSRTGLIDQINSELSTQVAKTYKEYEKHMGVDGAIKYKVSVLGGGFNEVGTRTVQHVLIHDYVIFEQLPDNEAHPSYLSLYYLENGEFIGASYKNEFSRELFGSVMNTLFQIEEFEFPKGTKYSKEMYNSKKSFDKYSIGNYFEDEGNEFLLIAKNEEFDIIKTIR